MGCEGTFKLCAAVYMVNKKHSAPHSHALRPPYWQGHLGTAQAIC
jgi:hypothetical protein